MCVLREGEVDINARVNHVCDEFVFNVGVVIYCVIITIIIIIIIIAFEMATVLALLVVVFCGDEEWKEQSDVLFLIQSFREEQRFF